MDYRDHLDKELQDVEEALAYLQASAGDKLTVLELALIDCIRALHRKIDGIEGRVLTVECALDSE